MNYTNELLKFAYIRGYLINNQIKINNQLLLTKDLFSLMDKEKEELINLAKEYGLKLYYFKEKEYLPRVSLVLGFLKNIYPEKLLDVGSGRGVFLFPLLNEFSNINIDSIEILPRRIELLNNIKTGGVSNLNIYNMDITKCSFNDNSYDVVTLLEVLEHIEQVEQAIEQAIRISKKFIVITVPSKEDDNPEHIHLLTKEKLIKIFNHYQINNLKFSGVNGHLFLIATK